MSKFKVTCLFVPDWPVVYKSLFGDAVHVESYTEGSFAYFTFDHPVTPSDLGPLVKIELISQ